MKDIVVENLRKYYGKVKAVDGISFEVEKGELFAFLGPNGAGKSTTIRVLTTLSKPTSGRVFVAGHDVVKEEAAVRRKIGLVSDKLILYDRLTVMENLMFFSQLYGLSKHEIIKRARGILEALEMWEWKDEQVWKLSTGMKQKVNVARALIPKPEVLFLDEPTLGLDPHSTRKIREFIKSLHEEGVTIVLTTHILHEVEILATKVAIINKGKIVAIDTPRNLKRLFKERETVQVEFEGKDVSIPENVEVLEKTDGYIKVETSDLKSFLETLSKQKVKILSLKTFEPSLEDIFVELTGGDNQ